MSHLRVRIGAVLCCCLVSSLVWAQPAEKGSAADQLRQAIKQFDQGDYLASQEAFTAIDRDQLTPSEQSKRDDYLNRVQVAITMEEKALRDLEDADTAIADGSDAQAKQLLKAVLANEYAPEPLRHDAHAKLRELEKNGSAPSQRSTQTQREALIAQTTESTRPGSAAPAHPAAMDDASNSARSLTAEGDTLVGQGRYEEAEDKYREALHRVSGYPEAVAGLQRIVQHRENTAGGQAESLAARIQREDTIAWQRAVTQYREAESVIRAHVQADRFEEARPLLVRARQIVESGKQFADPIVKYDNLRSELEALAEFVESAERTHNERQVAEIRDRIEQQRSEKLREIETRRTEKVEDLMLQAMEHRKDRDFRLAVNTLKQVVAIDPKNRNARWMMDMLEDEFQVQKEREVRRSSSARTLSALNAVEEAKIPWWQDLHYPDDWPELITRPERQRHRDAGNEKIISALDRPIDVDLRKTPFDQAIQHFVDAHDVNIIVNWHDLKNAGVQHDVIIDLSLPNEISLKKALTEVLDQAGAGLVDVGYEAADGAITVATKRTLATRTYPAVYPISDLLMELPSFTGAPVPDLRDASQATVKTERGARPAWEYGDDNSDEPEDDTEHAERARHLIDVIRSTIAPESWHERGGDIGTIREINGQLVITQNTANQRQIGGLLDKLREQRAIQISVEAIFLTVSSHYLEELGMDLDIVINGGNAGLDFVPTGTGALTDPVLGSRLLLPRTFSRLGFTPASPGLGTATTTTGNVPQPFQNPAFIPQGRGGSGGRFTPVPVLSGVTAFTDPSTLPSDIPGSFAGQAIGPALSIMGSFLDNIQVDFMIRATQADSRTSILTAPRIVVFNGGSAWVAVTVQTNFISTLNPVIAQGAVAQQPITGTIDAGASLFVRAVVTADRRYVMMLIAPGITRLLDLQTFPFSGGTGALDAFVQLPTLSAQRLQTMVSVPDGGTLLVGGQKLASETEIEAGVPVLSKIPILKRAYSSRVLNKDEQTLLILIKPKILIHSEQEELAFPGFTQR